MIFTIPTTLTRYTPVINWLYLRFKDHTDCDVEHDLHDSIRFLISLFECGENTDKLAYDLSHIDVWQTRTVAISDYKTPEYWNPIHETHARFVARFADRKIRAFNHAGQYPPQDIVYTHLNAILKISEYNGVHYAD